MAKDTPEEAALSILISDSDYSNPDSLAALGLGTYPNGRELAVFVQDPIPNDIGVQPYIAIPACVSNVPLDAKSRRGFEFVIDIGVYAPNTGSLTLVNNLCRRVRDLLGNVKAWDIKGMIVILTRIGWQGVAPTDVTLTGRIVTITVMAQWSAEGRV